MQIDLDIPMRDVFQLEVAETFGQVVEDELDDWVKLLRPEVLLYIIQTSPLARLVQSIDREIFIRGDDVVDKTDDIRMAQPLHNVERPDEAPILVLLLELVSVKLLQRVLLLYMAQALLVALFRMR